MLGRALSKKVGVRMRKTAASASLESEHRAFGGSLRKTDGGSSPAQRVGVVRGCGLLPQPPRAVAAGFPFDRAGMQPSDRGTGRMTNVSRSTLRFDGVDDGVDLGRKPEHKIPQDLTMEAWIFPTRLTQWAGVLSRVFDTNETESGYGLVLDGTGGIYAGIRTVAGPAQSFYYSSGANTIKTQQWQHVAATYDGKQVVIYVNGERKSVAPLSGAIDYEPDHALSIGAYRDNDENIVFAGKIAEVRLWRVARTAEQIQQSKDFALRGNEEGLVGYWPLDEGQGSTVSDRSKTGHHGQIAGATWEREEVSFGGADEERLQREREAFQQLQCAECEKERDLLKKQMSALQTQLAGQTAALASQRALLDEQQSALAQSRAKVDEQNLRLAELQKQVQQCADCEEEKASLAQRLAAQTQRVSELQSELTARITQKPAEPSEVAPTAKSPPVWPPPAAPAKVAISYIHFVGAIKGSQSDEYLELKNTGGVEQDVSGWHVHAGNTGQDFRFPPGSVLPPGQNFRVYTNQHTGRPGQFSFESKRPIWNDNGDQGLLCDASGALVSEYGYGSKETRTLEGIQATYGVEGLKILADAALLEKHKSARSKSDFLTAVERAIRSLLDDPADAATPNAANQIRDNYEGVPAGADDALIQRFIRQHLNQSQLRLLSDDSAEISELEVGSADHWVFLLKPGLGDLHFVIVERSGAKAAYQHIS